MQELNYQQIIEGISKLPDIHVDTEVAWSSVTTLGVGNAAIPVLAKPENDIALVKLIKHCANEKIPVFVLGAGSNTVGMDKPYPGIVVKFSKGDFAKVKAGRKHVTVGAGTKLYDFVSASITHGFGGYSSLAAIPGSVGGALRLNAGSFGISIADYVSEICGVTLDGNPWSANAKDIHWGYRMSSIPRNIIITGAIFKMPRVDYKEEWEKVNSVIAEKNLRYPDGRNAGCVFKNISPEDSAGKLIDDCGCKSFSCHNLRVSSKHANFIINGGGGSEEDFLELAVKVRKKVFEETGFFLEPEVSIASEKSLKKLMSSPKKLKVAALKGGNSNERKVSLESGAAVAEALRKSGYEVDEIDIKEPEVIAGMKEADVVFPVLHGGFGENGEIQKLMEDAGIKFVGCKSASCAVIIDKIKSKHVMEANGIRTPHYAVLTKENSNLPQNLHLPLVLKPPSEGSTVGIALVSSMNEWNEALEFAFKYDDSILVEEFVKGVEVTAAVLNGRALPLIEIKVPGKMYDYDAKYTHEKGETLYICPPESLEEDLQKKAQEIAVNFFKATKARDLLRVDMIIDRNGEIFVLEGNNIPGFTSSSLVPKAAKACGISFNRLCAQLAKTASQHED